jgi:hypothetical protein
MRGKEPPGDERANAIPRATGVGVPDRHRAQPKAEPHCSGKIPLLANASASLIAIRASADRFAKCKASAFSARKYGRRKRMCIQRPRMMEIFASEESCSS